VGKEDIDDLDFGTVPPDVVSMVEADCYWCLSALLDDIQVRLLWPLLLIARTAL
jgi:hypothetical protein